MAVTFMTGFEVGEAGHDGVTLTGGVSFTRGAARSGTGYVFIDPVSGVAQYFTVTAASYVHFGLSVSARPTTNARTIFGAIAAGTINVRLRTDGALDVYLNTTLIGTSAVLSTTTWYWIGIRQVTGTNVAFLQVNGLDSVSGTATVSATSGRIGFPGTETTGNSPENAYDDVVCDDAGFLAPTNVGLLVPTADSAGGTGWTLGTGTALGGNGFAALDNLNPQGVADLQAGSDPKQIRNASANANTSYDATMTTYTAYGVAASDVVLAVQPVISTAAPVSTSAKQGTVGLVSNPAIANIALAAGGVSGAFWSGVIAVNWATGWKASFGTMTAFPVVTRGTAPVMRVTQVTSSTRIAMVCFMGIYVAWSAGNGRTRPRIVNQAINRASSF
jgi:hypothetical protein